MGGASITTTPDQWDRIRKRGRFQVQAFRAFYRSGRLGGRSSVEAFCRAIVCSSDAVVDELLARNPKALDQFSQFLGIRYRASYRKLKSGWRVRAEFCGREIELCGFTSRTSAEDAVEAAAIRVVAEQVSSGG